MNIALNSFAGAAWMQGTPFARVVIDRAAYQQHQASTAEWIAFEKKLNNPPTAEESGLTAAVHHQLVSEALQVTAACLAKPRPERSDVMNSLVQRSVDTRLGNGFEQRWDLIRMNDELRGNADRHFIFGQVSGISEHSQFVGSWVIRHGDSAKRVLFDIQPAGVVTDITPVDELSVPLAAIRGLVHRGPAAWEHQVERDSAMGKWLVDLFGSARIGFIKGYDSLGVLSEAVAAVCKENQLSHMLLPRSRRDPGSMPWHIGAFLNEKPGSAVGPEVTFTWSDLAAYKGGRFPQLVQATVEVTLRCKIHQVLEMQNRTESPPVMA